MTGVNIVGGFVLLLFPLPFAAMPFSSFSTTTSQAHLAAILGLVGFGITAGIDDEVKLLRSSITVFSMDSGSDTEHDFEDDLDLEAQN